MENKSFTSYSLTSIGAGIPPKKYAELQKLFQDFYSANKALPEAEYRRAFMNEFGSIIDLFSRMQMHGKLTVIKNAALIYIIASILALIGILMMVGK
jgi:hypothetical protein